MSPTQPVNGDLDALLKYIHERRNFDFRGYKRPSLSRRIQKRMQQVGADDYQQYMDVLEANPGEFADLFNTILINVTSFLRDPEAWDALTEVVIPALAADKRQSEPIRIWSAGCASGEEAYSLALVFAEHLGEDRFRRQVKIYATDADSDALVRARQGRYAARDLLQAFGESRTERFFEVEEGRGTFRSDLRRSLIFGRHDLVQDPPISRIDLLSCRNTLMYFASEVQRQVLGSFHFALNQGGYLFLGKSESLAARTNLFEAVDARRHIFVKDGSGREGGYMVTQPSNRTVAPPGLIAGRSAEALLEQSPIPQVVVDANATVLHANLQARRLLSMGSAEVGVALNDTEMRLPGDLHKLLDQVIRDRRMVAVADAIRGANREGEGTYDMLLAPLQDQSGISIAFVDISRFQQLRSDLEGSQRELESAYEELQSAVEELETTNEELQSTNEELETTNEELHSTNEELETMNEELQSTNEELETMNTEYRERTSELDELNTFLESILASIRSAVVVLGPEMEIRAWNRQAVDLWGLMAEEVLGQHFFNLDIGFPVEVLGPSIRECLAGRSETVQLTQRAVNRRGQHFDCAVSVTRLLTGDAARGVIVLMHPAEQEEGSGNDDR